MRSKLVAAFVALALARALFACEDIIGLDKFHKCGSELDCDASTNDAAVDASDAGASDVLVVPDVASEASSWPRWRIDNTPFEVDGGASDASLAHFVPSSGNTITDLVAKSLVWKAQLGTASSIEEAAAFCVNIKGRLPTRIEVATLLDSTRAASPYIAPAFDAVVMPDGAPPPASLWTSSYHRPVDAPKLHYWFASLQTGDMLQQAPSANTGVLCLQ